VAAPHITPEQLLQHQDWLFRLVRRLVKDDFTADDMVQATMVEALADERAGSSNLRGWLGSTARRLTAQHWRSNFRRHEREQKVAVDDHAVMHQSADLSELFQVANTAIVELPEQERVVVMLRHMQGWKSERVAAELKIPLDDVYRDTEHGCKKLRDRLQAKYGQDWKASCIALLGMPMGRSAVATFGPALGIAASVAVLLLGAWLSSLFAKDSVPEFTPSAALLAAQTPDSLAPTSSSSEFGSIDRKALNAPLEQDSGYAFRAVNSLGATVSNAKVTLNFRDQSSYFFPAQRTSLTDSSGVTYFSLPPEMEPVGVIAAAEGLFHRNIPQRMISLKAPTILSFEQGVVPSFFQTNPSMEGVRLIVTNESNDMGLCVTDAAGRASLLLPTAGKYTVTPENERFGFEQINFQVLQGGTESPIPVPVLSPASFTLVCVDSQSGATLTNATYSLVWDTKDENRRPSGYASQQLESSRGVLTHQAKASEASQALIKVEAEGYLNAFVIAKGQLTESTQIKLQRMESVLANLQLSEPGRHLVSAKIHFGSPRFNLSAEGLKFLQLYSAKNLPQTLEVLNRTQVKIDRPENGEQYEFFLSGVDDIGNTWHSRRFTSADYQRPNLLFPLDPEPAHTTNLKFLHDPSPESHYVYTANLPYYPGRFQGVLTPDESNNVTLKTSPGERITTYFSDARFFCDLGLSLPETPGDHFYSIRFPERTSTLHGQVTDALGIPITNVAVTAYPKQSIEVLGPGRIDLDEGSTGFDLAIQDGILHGKFVFAGEYDLEIKYPGHTFHRTVSADEDFDIQAPALGFYQFRIMDRTTGDPLAGTLNRRRNLGPLLPMRLGMGDPLTGHLVVWVDTAESAHGLFLMAHGYQPVLLSNYIYGSPQNVELSPGRPVSIPFSTLSIDVDPEAHWTLDAWGEDTDPRQTLVRRFQQLIQFEGAPLEDFMLIEREADGTRTGRSIEVFADGSAQAHTS